MPGSAWQSRCCWTLDERQQARGDVGEGSRPITRAWCLPGCEGGAGVDLGGETGK